MSDAAEQPDDRRDADAAADPDAFRFWPSLLFHGVVFALITGTLWTIADGGLTGRTVASAAVAGLVFGTLMALFHRRRAAKYRRAGSSHPTP